MKQKHTNVREKSAKLNVNSFLKNQHSCSIADWTEQEKHCQKQIKNEKYHYSFHTHKLFFVKFNNLDEMDLFIDIRK